MDFKYGIKYAVDSREYIYGYICGNYSIIKCKQLESGNEFERLEKNGFTKNKHIGYEDRVFKQVI